MITFGCNIFDARTYEEDVRFAISAGFDFFQLGYTARGFCMYERDVPPWEAVTRAGFPVVVHALLRPSELSRHLPQLLASLQEMGCRDLIIHPTLGMPNPEAASLPGLIAEMHRALTLFTPVGIPVYLENNSAIDPIFNSMEHVEAMFAKNPQLGFVLDIAHASDYEELCGLVEIRMPDILHLADRRIAVPHEHLPLGQGDIDFERIMRGPLVGFGGKVIFEVPPTDDDRLAARTAASGWYPAA